MDSASIAFKLAFAGLLALSSMGAGRAEGQQRRTSLPRSVGSRTATSLARFAPAANPRARTSLNTQQRLELFQDMTGVLLDAAALDQPVRMTVNYPAHAGGRVVVSLEGGVADPGPDVEHPGFWILRTTSMDVDVYESTLFVQVTRAAHNQPVLVDCEVDASSGVDLKLIDLHGSTQLLTLKGAGHILTVLQPPSDAMQDRAWVMKMVRPSSSMTVHYCEITAMK
jgi:hypothetical protein